MDAGSTLIMTIYSLITSCQGAVSQVVHQSVCAALPLPIDHISTIARIYGIQAIFLGPRDRYAGGANVDLNRWVCRTDGVNVRTIALG